VTRKYPSTLRNGDWRLADSEDRTGAGLGTRRVGFAEDDATQQLIDMPAVVAPLLLFL
jgi:hypothetical protein